MITTATLNPMLDKTVRVDAIVLGGTVRATEVGIVVGGKGVNVSRQLRHFGDDTTLVTFLAGKTGETARHLLEQEHLSSNIIEIPGMTREGVTYRCADGSRTAVFEPSPAVAPKDARAFVDACASLLPASTWLVCSGSSPCQSTDRVYHEIIAAARARSVKTALDSYGEAFLLGLDASPTLVKPNRDEYERMFHRRLDSTVEVMHAFDFFLQKGVEMVVLSDGMRPCYAATKDLRWKVSPPNIQEVNPTGSGDCMIAGMLHGFEKGWSFPRCLAFGVAAGAANARVWEVATATLDEVSELARSLKVEELSR